MVDKPLDNLSREELIALVQSLQQQLRQRVLVMDEAGSIAQAAMALSGVFQASQQAADQYLESAEAMKLRQESDYHRRLTQAEQQAQALLAQTRQQCQEMVTHAEESAQFYWDALNRRIEELMSTQSLPQASPTTPAEPSNDERFGPDD